MITPDELWILSYYRYSEISGAMFFGALTRVFRTGIIGHNLTRHFSDEGRHAWYWSECLRELGHEPVTVDKTYQEQYLEATGIPVNLMEILAVTQVFEKRVINQYARHKQAPNLHPRIAATFAKIMEDEKWHIQWVRKALCDLEPEYGKENVASTLRRFEEADREIYARTLKEQEQRIEHLFRKENH